MNAIFRLSNFLVLPFWALMIIFPRWRWTERIMKSPLVSLAPALVYEALALWHLPVIWPAIARPTLPGVAQLLGSPSGATTAWVHFLAFDLFVGRWIYWDSRERRISPWLASPALFLTLMLGPLGFVLYLCVRVFARPEFLQTKSSADAVKPDSSTLIISNQFRTDILQTLRTRLRQGFDIDRPLTILGCVMVLTLLGTLVGLVVDPRVITGAPAWLKPAKFSISVSVYCFTLVWLLGFIENRPRLVRIVTRAIVFSLVVEMVAIIMQAVRGTTSHFNMSTSLNSLLWGTMGAFIMVVWVMTMVLTVVLIRQRLADKAFAWSLRWGLIISLLGMAAAFFMVRLTPEQRVSAHGVRPKIVGAHSIGVPDGGPGLPLVGWSTVGGDMRVAHFVGLHALQVLPFLGWLITRKRNRPLLNDDHRLALVWITASVYASIVVLLMCQALRGESVIHPDKTILLFAGIVIAVAAVAVLSVIRQALGQRRMQGQTEIEMASN